MLDLGRAEEWLEGEGKSKVQGSGGWGERRGPGSMPGGGGLRAEPELVGPFVAGQHKAAALSAWRRVSEGFELPARLAAVGVPLRRQTEILEQFVGPARRPTVGGRVGQRCGFTAMDALALGLGAPTAARLTSRSVAGG